MQPPITLNGPLGLGELLDGAFRLYHARFSKLALTAAVFLVPLGVVASVMLGAAVGGFGQFMLSAAAEPTTVETMSFLGSFGAFVLVTLAGYILTMLAWVSLTSQAVALVEGEEISTREAIRRGLRRLLPFVGMVVLYALAIGLLVAALYIAVMFVAFGLILVLGAVGGSIENATVIGIGIAIMVLVVYFVAFAALIAPAGFLSARWLAAPTIVVAERLGPVSSLSRSWSLTRRNGWRCFGYLVLLVVFNVFVLGLPLAILQSLLVFLLTPQWMAVSSGVIVGLNYFLNVLWYPFLVLALVLLYFDLRIRSESYDLDLRIKQLEESVRPTSLPT